MRAGFHSRPGRAARARATKSCTASASAIAWGSASSELGGRPSGGTGYSCSTCSRSGKRLVTSSFRPGRAARRAANWGPAARICSKLSSSSRRRPCRKVTSRSWGLVPACSRSPRAVAINGRVRAGSSTEVRSTKATPSENSSRSSAATWRASLVLPVPPGPVRLTRRAEGRHSRAQTAATSTARPIKLVGGAGRLCAVAGAPGWVAGGPAGRTASSSKSTRPAPRAARRKAARSAGATARAAARRSASWLDGRRSSASIRRIMASVQPASSASLCWVRSCAFRRRRSQ